MSTARAIVAALAALEAGNLGEAEAILLGVLEDGPSARGCQCPVCRLRLEWPGQVEEHLRNVHGVVDGVVLDGVVLDGVVLETAA